MVVIARRCLVSGRVQGVYYRATAARRASELGVTGCARNLPDGRVEVLVFGDAAAVDSFVAWLWTGSTASRVVAVDSEELVAGEHSPPTEFTTA